MRIGIGSVLLAAFAASALAQPPAVPPVVKPACDRTCLEGYVDKYLDAMLAHKVSDDLFARDVKFTENGVRFPLGHEGLWFNMSAKGSYKFYVPDTEIQQVAFIGTVRYGATPAIAAVPATATTPARPAAPANPGTLAALALRLKIVEGRITEVEQLAIRPDVPLGAAAPAPSRFPPTGEAVEKIGKPHPVFAEVIPEAKRPSREELIKTANYYFSGLAHNDGKGYYPFTDDCVRFENGVTSTTECKKQFQESLKGVVDRIRDRRFVAVDRERGIVFAFGFFDHARINWTWQIAELFKIENGNIRRIEAVFHRAPYGIQSGWSTYEQGYSEDIQIPR
jgi:hypothetical protein